MVGKWKCCYPDHLFWIWRSVPPVIAGTSVGGATAIILSKSMIRKLERPAVLGHGAHDAIRRSGGNLGLDLKRHRYVRAYQSCQVCDDFLGDPTRVAAHASGVRATDPWKRRGSAAGIGVIVPVLASSGLPPGFSGYTSGGRPRPSSSGDIGFTSNAALSGDALTMCPARRPRYLPAASS